MFFKDIIGQQEVKKQLIQTVRESRVSHAQLFLGPEGNGSLSLALAYSQYINCKNRTDDDACGTCPSCVKYNKLIHPDLHFIYPVATTQDVDNKPTSKDFAAKWRELVVGKKGYINLAGWFDKIGIEKKQGIINADDCNEIIKTLGYKSYESEYKVMVIWMAEKLYYSAAPKILKILEEPPDKTLFILISENQDQIISTILSRCQLVKIPKIKDNDLQEGLKERLECDTREALDISRFADGNWIEALNLYEQPDKLRLNTGEFIRWMRLCYAFNIKDINGFVREIAGLGREKQKDFINLSIRMFRNSMLKNFRIESLLKVNEEESEFLYKFSPYLTPEKVEQIVSEFNKAHFHIERNANASIVFMDLSLKASYLLKS